jgi:Flp pilus assembly protein TadG
MLHHRIRKIRNLRRSRRLHWLSRFRRDEHGVQLLELAIVLPILFVLFGAVAEFGRYFYEYTTAAKAARVGARYLADKSVTSGQNHIGPAKSLVVYGNTNSAGSPVLTGLDVSNVDVQYTGVVSGVPDTVTVSIINYKHQPVFDLGKLLNVTSLRLDVDVKPSVTMRFLLTQPGS